MNNIALFLVSDGVSLVFGALAVLFLMEAVRPAAGNRVLRTSQLYLIIALTITIITTILSGYLNLITDNRNSRIICEIIQYASIYSCYLIYTKYVGDELNVTVKAYEILYYLYAAAMLVETVLIAEGRIIDYGTDSYRIGSLYWTGFIYPAVITVVITILVCLNRTRDPAAKVTLVLYMYLPAVGIIMMMVFYENFLQRLCSLSFVMLVYLIIYIDCALKIVKREKELEESRIALMISQIQPHFIYNTLNSIAGLCELDSAKARDLTLKFSDYLRNNIHALESKEAIPFSDELNHIRNYLEIEQQRFRHLKVEYNIEIQGFYVPALTIQPLVENAVKHGISVKRGGGTVSIRTHETDKRIKIIIADDGVGFDTTEPIGDSHLGITNTRTRLESIGGRLSIKSERGLGTRVTVSLPKEDRKTAESDLETPLEG